MDNLDLNFGITEPNTNTDPIWDPNDFDIEQFLTSYEDILEALIPPQPINEPDPQTEAAPIQPLVTQEPNIQDITDENIAPLSAECSHCNTIITAPNARLLNRRKHYHKRKNHPGKELF